MQRRFLSYVVDSPDEVFISDPMVAIGPGRNVFSVTVTDPEEFRKLLEDSGCRVVSVNALDDLEPITPEVVAETLPEIAPFLNRRLPGG